MKKLIKTKTALAVLTAKKTSPEPLAVLSFSVGEIDSINAERVQLLPDGYFSAKDGRPDDVANGKWLMDEQAFATLKASASLRTNDFLFDYEHQTMNSEENGKEAPAAGWFKDFDYVPGEGLFATQVDWTPPATARLKNKEYRYTSAVFSYDPQTGRPVALMHAALTNDPALDGMKAIVVLKAQSNVTTTNPSGEEPMNKALEILLGLLGVAQDGEDLTNAVALKAAEARATTAIAALKTKADRTGVAETELAHVQASVAALKTKADRTGVAETELAHVQASVAALKAGGSTAIDPTKFVPIETYNAVNTQLAALKNGTDENSVEQLLKDNAAKITGQADRDYLATVGKSQGAVALKAMLEPRIAIAALTNTQTQGKKTPEVNTHAALTTEQLAVCKNMNISHADFTAQLQGES
jgi:phage I-like protein